MDKSIEERCQKLAEQLAWFAKQAQGTASHNSKILVNKLKNELLGMYHEGRTDERRSNE